MMRRFKRIPAGTLLAGGFALTILIGTAFLLLPAARNPGVRLSFLDALFTATSAVCVTGMTVMDTATAFSGFGRVVIALLIQLGGLGVMCVGVGLILLARGSVSLKGRELVQESLNLDSPHGALRLIRSILAMTLCVEAAGAALSYLSFRAHYPPLKALEVSVFHAVAAFNNSGFDMLGGSANLIPYRNDILLNLTTAAMLFLGGIGFLVVLDVFKKRRFGDLAFHSKVVLTMSLTLTVAGALFLKATQEITWLGAFFQSLSARTAGFSTYAPSGFTSAGLFAISLLMFVGSSPGSTGGGIKTSTLFTLLQTLRGVMRNRQPSAFKRCLPRETVLKAFVVTLISAMLVITGTLILSLLEPEYEFLQIFFEVNGAFSTVGLSTGITPELGYGSKLLLIALMFTGRLGPLTVASLWAFKYEANARYSEEELTIG